MSYMNAFIVGMRSAFDFAPKQETHKANFITDANTPKVNVHIVNTDLAGAWVTVGSYMRKAGSTYEIKHASTNKKAVLSD